jgi:hypothetical protein
MLRITIGGGPYEQRWIASVNATESANRLRTPKLASQEWPRQQRSKS